MDKRLNGLFLILGMILFVSCTQIDKTIIRASAPPLNYNSTARADQPVNFTVTLLSYPSNASPGQKIKLSWKVEGQPRIITHTSIHYGNISVPHDLGIHDDPRFTHYDTTPPIKTPTFDIPDSFSDTITVPSSGTIYFRAHAVIAGENKWSEEGRIKIIK